MTVQSKFREALPYLPLCFQQPLSRIPAETAAEIQEIRLRIGQPMQVVTGGSASVISPQGTLVTVQSEGIIVTRQALDTAFRNLCAHSVHSFQAAIRQGYLTIAGGSRAGLCGTAVLQGTTLDTVRSISGINLRIASERIGCAEELCRRLGSRLRSDGILLAGAPASGKTTLLRDLTRIIAQTRRVSLLDERGELAAVQNGIPQFDLGTQTDVFDGYPKAAGIEIAVRVMSPEVLICDEIGNAEETDALLQSLHTGVQIIASAHAGTLTELRSRPQIARLIAAGVFRTGILLGCGAQCGQVIAVGELRGGVS